MEGKGVEGWRDGDGDEQRVREGWKEGRGKEGKRGGWWGEDGLKSPLRSDDH